MHGLQACLFKYITVAAFHIFALRGEDTAKRGGWRLFIKVMEITLLIMKNHGIVFLNFCGNPAKRKVIIVLPKQHQASI